MKPHRLVLLGPPASGKGTQGQLMIERWGVPVVSAGEVLRREIAAGTDLGVEAARYMGDGGLVPDRIALASVEGWLVKQRGGFVFDGFPRTVGQAEMLEKILAERQTPLEAVIWLDVPLETIAHRVSRRLVCTECGRSFQIGTHVAGLHETCPVCGGKLAVRHDDEPQKLAVRMAAYAKSTQPLTVYYEERGLLRRIEADRPPEEVFAQIEATVEQGVGA